jgi:hypothetical protein
MVPIVGQAVLKEDDTLGSGARSGLTVWDALEHNKYGRLDNSM